MQAGPGPALDDYAYQILMIPQCHDIVLGGGRFLSQARMGATAPSSGEGARMPNTPRCVDNNHYR